MTKLERDLAALRRFFEPWHTRLYGTAIWAPEDSDPNASVKRDIIAKAIKLIATGDSALAGIEIDVPQFCERDITAIDNELAGDPEQRDFLELAVGCENIVRSLSQVA